MRARRRRRRSNAWSGRRTFRPTRRRLRGAGARAGTRAALQQRLRLREGSTATASYRTTRRPRWWRGELAAVEVALQAVAEEVPPQVAAVEVPPQVAAVEVAPQVAAVEAAEVEAAEVREAEAAGEQPEVGPQAAAAAGPPGAPGADESDGLPSRPSASRSRLVLEPIAPHSRLSRRRLRAESPRLRRARTADRSARVAAGLSADPTSPCSSRPSLSHPLRVRLDQGRLVNPSFLLTASFRVVPLAEALERPRRGGTGEGAGKATLRRSALDSFDLTLQPL